MAKFQVAVDRVGKNCLQGFFVLGFHSSSDNKKCMLTQAKNDCISMVMAKAKSRGSGVRV